MKKYMNNLGISQEHVVTFMRTAGQAVKSNVEGGASTQQTDLYIELINEEIDELREALAADDTIETADAIADIIWVLLGLATTLGYDMHSVWDEVRRSNMSKFPEDGKIVVREDGKLLKPATFFPPNIKQALGIADD